MIIKIKFKDEKEEVDYLGEAVYLHENEDQFDILDNDEKPLHEFNYSEIESIVIAKES